ncbi:DUF4231 domain-containing protein [Amycolatopsis sp. NPDC052450]|uniref:DUF4231 domain-containing protein n=1 Tax=Amycolatopsis sp. NPDC052450 TaxID=3363937 RepID=UPI0037C82ED1
MASRSASKQPGAEQHWMLAVRPGGQPLPVTVTAKWEWYRSGSTRHRRRYAAMELVAICGAAAIPVVAATPLPSLVVAVLGSIVLVATSVRTTFGLHENWVEQSQIRYAIEREVALYLVKAPPYDSDDAAAELVTTVEAITRDAGRHWAARRLHGPPTPPAPTTSRADG